MGFELGKRAITSPPSRALERREARVLDVARHLCRTLETVSLETIDGEFYWRCGRPEFVTVLEAARRVGPPVPVEELATVAGMRKHDAYVKFRAWAGRIVPLPVLDALVRDEPVAMRMPQVTLHEQLTPDGEDYVQWASILVYSGLWTGADVERSVASAPTWRKAHNPGLGKDWVSVQVDFAFIEDTAQARRYWRSVAPLRVPFIAMQVGMPLPPTGAIAREYDAIVRDMHGWHLRLPDAMASRQEKEVAVRTWAVGFLVAGGVTFGQAMPRVCGATGLIEVSQTRFGEDRKRLMVRVPEAAEILMQRKRPA
jgi:hypothetical protein